MTYEKLNAVGKALAVLDTIAQKGRPMSVKELAMEMGVNKSSLHHHLKTMREMNYLFQSEETRRYDIGPKIVEAAISLEERASK